MDKNWGKEEIDLPINIIELTNGCLDCTVQEKFLHTMPALIDRQDDIDGIAIEISGLALPKPLITAKDRASPVRTLSISQNY